MDLKYFDKGPAMRILLIAPILFILTLLAFAFSGCAHSPRAPGAAKLVIRADKDGTYSEWPKHFQSYGDNLFILMQVCAINTQNVDACVCATWNLAEQYDAKEIEKMEDKGTAVWGEFLSQCEKKFPLPTSM